MSLSYVVFGIVPGLSSGRISGVDFEARTVAGEFSNPASRVK